MKKKIAQVGTFDVENFGDLLFPVIMEYYMRDYEIDLFSPKGNCIKPFEKAKFVYSLDALEARCQENSYEAIVVGGGELIRCDTVLASHYNSKEENISLKMWALPILVGSRYDIPVIFNAPGVPFRFNKSMHGMIKELFEKVPVFCGYDQVEQAEAALSGMGYSDFRVRVFHGAARLQLPGGQLSKAVEQRGAVREALAPWFETVLLDLKAR